MKQYIKQMRLKLATSSQKGSALIAVLVLIPLLTAGGVALYSSNSPAEYTLNVTAEDTAIYAAQTGVSQVVNSLFNSAGISPESKMSTLLSGAAVGDVVDQFDDKQVTTGTLGAGRSYAALNSRYKAIWLSVDPVNPKIRVTARVFNSKAASYTSGGRLAEYSIVQTFTLGSGAWDTSVTGCAGKYDYWAGNDYHKYTALSVGDTDVYYTGKDWRLMGFTPPFIPLPYIDAGGNAKKTFSSICGKSQVNCNFTPALTFGGAIGSRGYGADGIPNNGDDVNWINVCGDATTCGYSTGGYVNGDGNDELPYAQSWENHVLQEVTNGSGDLTGAATSSIGHFHYLDMNHNGLPDSPYFYYSAHNGADRDLDEVLPFSYAMFKNKEVYIYVKGSVNTFQFGSGNFMNFKKLNVIAKKDINEFSLMSMDLASSGVNFIAGNDFNSSSMMKMSGLSNVTILANHDIIKNGGMWDMQVGGRTHFVAGHDIVVTSMASFNFTKSSGDHDLVCSATDTTRSEPFLSLGINYPN